MKRSDAILLQNCRRASLIAFVDGRSFHIMVKKYYNEGFIFSVAQLLHPLVAFAFATKHELGTNEWIKLQNLVTEPTPEQKEKLRRMFNEIDIEFLTPADWRSETETSA